MQVIVEIAINASWYDSVLVEVGGLPLVTIPALTLAGVGAGRARIVGGKRHPAGPQMVSSTASLFRLVQANSRLS